MGLLSLIYEKYPGKSVITQRLRRRSWPPIGIRATRCDGSIAVSLQVTIDSITRLGAELLIITPALCSR
jgi:hypothetical protein